MASRAQARPLLHHREEDGDVGQTGAGRALMLLGLAGP
jgi:hypothetical protein